MKIKVDHTYKTVGGWTATVLMMDWRGHFLITHPTPEGDANIWHYPEDEGRSNINYMTTQYDLIEEVTEQE